MYVDGEVSGEDVVEIFNLVSLSKRRLSHDDEDITRPSLLCQLRSIRPKTKQDNKRVNSGIPSMKLSLKRLTSERRLKRNV